jgi:hypothetical protein
VFWTPFECAIRSDAYIGSGPSLGSGQSAHATSEETLHRHVALQVDYFTMKLLDREAIFCRLLACGGQKLGNFNTTYGETGWGWHS